MEGELQEDWEVVLRSSGSTQEEDNPKSLEEIGDEDGTQGMITSDYFSLVNSNSVSREDAIDEDGSAQSGSPGWIEPRADAPYGPKQFSELWSDSSSDRLEDQRLDDGEMDNELGSVGNSESLAKEKDWSCSSGEIDSASSSEGTGTERVDGSRVPADPFVKSGVWWRIPLEVLKYCVFRVNPVWSFSMAAAVVGFVMLGRRLYNMKKKSRTLQLKVLLDDKKVANHAARLNEAISLVKRVPIIRPALPSSVGMNQWPMMSLR